MKDKILSIGFLLMAAGVMLGAFGAHGLKDYFTGNEENVWKTAVFYHLIHAMGIFIVYIFHKLEILTAKAFSLSSFLFISGILLFSGSLYLLVFCRVKWFGAITPIGGSLLILNWLYLGWIFLRGKFSNRFTES